MTAAINKTKGFTLIEVMITVVIVAILAVIAYPAYQEQVRKARRSDAMDALMYLQILQEKYRANNPNYGTLGQTGYVGNITQGGHYRLEVSGNTATGYSLKAIALGVQADDAGCTEISITVSPGNPLGEKGPTGCWKK